MKHDRVVISLLVVLFFFVACQSRQKTVITEEDYSRAEAFLPWKLEKKVYGLEVSPRWIGKGNSFWYRLNTREGIRFLVVGPDQKTKKEAFDHARLALALSQETGEHVTSGDLPFKSFKYIDKDRKKIEFEVEKRIWTVDLEDYKLTSRDKEEQKPRLEQASPDGKWVAFAKDYNLYIRNTKNKKEIRLSRDGRELYEYAYGLGWAGLIKGENGPKKPSFRVKWSPDSKKIYVQILDLRQARKMYLLNSVNDDYRAELYSYYRASPGDENMAYYIPIIFDIEKNRKINVDLEPLPVLPGSGVSWLEDGRRLHARILGRGFKTLDIYEIDAETGKKRAIARDKSPTSIEFYISRHKVLSKAEKVLLTSERDGWNHIYLYDWKTSRLENQVTRGEFVVLNMVHVDEEGGRIYFTAVGREKGEDPYLVHLYRVNFDGSELRSLTPEHAYHEISLSPDKAYFVDNISRIDLPTKSVLRSLEDGTVVMELEQADIQDVLAMGWTYPEPFKLKAGDSTTDIFGSIWRPTRFDASQKYPVIDYTYTGPQSFRTPKTFKKGLLNYNSTLAELGFICISVDGRGTAWRNKAFHDFSYNNLGGGCEDHIPAIQEMSKKYPSMDISRVGIYGHSAGGYDTVRALLMWPDFYKVGVSSSGNHDHRMAKAWWPEQYMGYPVGKFYDEQSNITMAGNLIGKLLLVHGDMDGNVNPAATIRLADALIKNNKDFDLLILPSNRHGFTGIYKDYFLRKKWDFFVRYLHGIEPPQYRIAPVEED